MTVNGDYTDETQEEYEQCIVCGQVAGTECASCGSPLCFMCAEGYGQLCRECLEDDEEDYPCYFSDGSPSTK